MAWRHGICVVALAAGCGRSTSDDSSPSDTRHLAYIADSQELGRFELHVVDVSASTPASKMISTGLVQQAAWSPDGRFLAFSTDIALVVADALEDFSLRQLHGAVLRFEWSPSSRHLAYYVSGATPTLVISDLLSENPDIVETLSTGALHGHAWSPAGDAYVFARSQFGGAQGEWLVAKPGAVTTALPPLGSETHPPVWSPDGRYLAIVARPDDGSEPLYLLNVADGSAPRLLEPDAVNPSFSHDSRLVIARGPQALLAFALDAPPELARQALSGQLSGWQIGNGGRTLVYGADLDAEPWPELYAASLDDGTVSEPRLLHDRVDDFTTSPNSDAIVFRAEYGEQLFVVRAAGRPVEALHEAGLASANSLPAISPSGERALLELQPVGPGSPEHIDHRVVGLAPVEMLFQFTISDSTRIQDAKWGDETRFSFVHEVTAADGFHSWQSLHVGDVTAQSLMAVYASTSNLRELRWTGWQP